MLLLLLRAWRWPCLQQLLLWLLQQQQPLP
jgi:hypothetical protein